MDWNPLSSRKRAAVDTFLRVACLALPLAVLAFSAPHPAAAQCPTSFTLASSRNPSDVGQLVTFTVTVLPTTFVGSIFFLDGARPLNQAAIPLVNGIATYAAPGSGPDSLSAGLHPILAEIRGPNCFFGATVLQTVRSTPPTPTPTPGQIGADLSVQLCGTTYPDIGQIVFTFSATVTNRGPLPATGVTLRLSPAIIAGKVTPSQGSCPGIVAVGQCDLGTLPAGGTATISFDSGFSFLTDMRVVVFGDQPDPVPSNNTTGIVITPVNCEKLTQACPLLSILGQLICESRNVDSCNGASAMAPGPLRYSQSAAPFSLQTFYGLRDKVFGSTPSGRRYTQLYYEYGREVTRLILTSPTIAAQAFSTASMWQENVQALVDGHGDAATISTTQTDALSGFIESLKAAASPELRAVLVREQAALNLAALASKTMSQAWARQQQTAPATLTVPAAASIHGVNGSFFHSDLRLLNASATSLAAVTLRYHCFTGTCPNNVQTLTLTPGEMRSLDDVVGTTFGAPESAGPIEIVGDVIVDSRIYTPTRPSPTTGASVPGFAADEALAESVLLSLSHSVNRSKGFRTNAGVYNPSTDYLHVTFSLFDAAATPIGQTSRDVGPGTEVQINDLFGSSGIVQDVPNAYAIISADGVHELFAYATVIDNQSQDPVFVKGRNARGAPSGTVTLPTAASIHGLNGSFFHSDLRVFNPSVDAPATVTARYRCFTGSCPSSLQTFTVAPREMKTFDDAIVALFSAPESAGPIELSGAVVVDSRVYSPGKPAATTGDDVAALGAEQAATRLVLTSLSRSADPAKGFRTNVGVYNPGVFPLTVIVSLYGPSGQLLGTATRSLESQSALQINDVFGAAGVAGDIPNAYCVVAAQGPGSPLGLDKVFAYATVIDNQSQDPYFVLGRPLPADATGPWSSAPGALPIGVASGVFIPLLAIGGALAARRRPASPISGRRS